MSLLVCNWICHLVLSTNVTMKSGREELFQEKVVQTAQERPSHPTTISDLILEQEICPILNGRPSDKTGLPVSLYHPVFDQFKASSRDDTAEITSKQLAACSELCAVAVELEKEPNAVPLCLQSLLPQYICAPSGEDIDPVVKSWVWEFPCYRAIFDWEDSSDTEADSCDAATRAAFSYRDYLIQPTADALRKGCNCPCFIVTITGPWMAVYGAVFVQYPVVELLEHVWLGAHPTYAEDQLYRIARLFLALNQALKSLETFYAKASYPIEFPVQPGTPGRFFPHVFWYPVADGPIVFFDYLTKLADETSPTNAVFKARTKHGKLIVIKFVQRYNAVAHRLLADLGLAPPLLYAGTDPGAVHGNIAGLYMVVMEFIDGETAYDAPHKFTGSMFEDISAGIHILHDEGLVFGDLRSSNIMIENDRAFMVDFDWCAERGVGRYPAGLNDLDEEIGWHLDVRRGGVMEPEHDLFMLQKLDPDAMVL